MTGKAYDKEIIQQIRNATLKIKYSNNTFLHFDHFCPDHLPKGLRLIAQNHEDAEKIRQMGFENTAAFESERLSIDDVVIHKTKAFHGDSEEVVKKMGEVCGYVFEAPGEKHLYLAADTIYCQEVEQNVKRYQPEGIILNCCEATTPLGRLIMNLSDVENVCQAAGRRIIRILPDGTKLCVGGPRASECSAEYRRYKLKNECAFWRVVGRD